METWCSSTRCLVLIQKSDMERCYKMFYLHSWENWLSLLSSQAYSAHWNLWFAPCDTRQIHLAKILCLHTYHSPSNDAKALTMGADNNIMTITPESSNFINFLPVLWIYWACFRWLLPFAHDSQDEKAWQWNSRGPTQEKTTIQSCMNTCTHTAEIF